MQARAQPGTEADADESMSSARLPIPSSALPIVPGWASLLYQHSLAVQTRPGPCHTAGRVPLMNRRRVQTLPDYWQHAFSADITWHRMADGMTVHTCSSSSPSLAACKCWMTRGTAAGRCLPKRQPTARLQQSGRVLELLPQSQSSIALTSWLDMKAWHADVQMGHGWCRDQPSSAGERGAAPDGPHGVHPRLRQVCGQLGASQGTQQLADQGVQIVVRQVQRQCSCRAQAASVGLAAGKVQEMLVSHGPKRLCKGIAACSEHAQRAAPSHMVLAQGGMASAMSVRSRQPCSS